MLQSYANFALFIEFSTHIELNFLGLFALFVINKRKLKNISGAYKYGFV